MIGKCEICQKIDNLEEHHIQSKSKGGKNNKSNIAIICCSCHRKIHIGSVVVIGRFLTDEGYKLLWREEKGLKLVPSEPEVYKIP